MRYKFFKRLNKGVVSATIVFKNVFYSHNGEVLLMTIKVDNNYGAIYINNEVIATIAGAAAVECYGLVGMASRSASNGIVSLLKKENLSKGVKIKADENGIIIDLFVIIQFGTKISVVAQNIIERVKYSVENQTGLKVLKVNLNIEGVRVQG